MIMLLVSTSFTALPPSSLSQSQINEQNSHKGRGSQGFQAESASSGGEEDYAFIDPTPIFYPGHGAPIPHAQISN
ncbi:hypothetical protein FRX31_014309 [Thalictrum thalictroides]|uniref:Transmembrane protein n=1 Tax=Thalictrum thalictroides TaxID=46969 RepID=A0A7J6WGR7_THATH|nr:hypothetical protein FRX31_014309 [Thalictrum thalictroides]